MSLKTTAVSLSTTPSLIISTGTTWGNTNTASITDTVPFSMYNQGSVNILILSTNSTSETGFPLLSSAIWTANLMASDQVWARTASGTSTAILIAGRQNA